jgi:hypothetical protein
MRRPAVLAVLAALLLAQAAGASEHASPTAANSGSGWRDIAIQAAPVALNGPEAVARGVAFMGALDLTSPDIDRLHGLSDLKFTSPTDFLAVSDEGWLAGARVRLDPAGRLVGVEAGRMKPLLGELGDRLFDRPRRGPDNYDTWADSEGLAVYPDGRFLVSFEHHQRIWKYGVDRTGPDLPRAMISPPMPIDYNYGFEAVAVDGRKGYYAGAESGGVWHCAKDRCLQLADQPEPPTIKDDDLRITSFDRDPLGRGLFVLERSFSRANGTVVRVSLWHDPDRGGFDQRVPVFELKPPLTVDNMEGIAAVKSGRGVRLYLIADDNFSPSQRSLLMAFDLTPEAGGAR